MSILISSHLSILKQLKFIYLFLLIDFILKKYLNVIKDSQILWATDLNISYTDHMALSSLLFYLTNGHFDSESHLYEVSNSDTNDDVLKLKKSKRHLVIHILLIF